MRVSVDGTTISLPTGKPKLSTRQRFRMRRALRLFHKHLAQYEGLPNVQATRDAIFREIQKIKPQTDRLLFG